MQSAAAWVALGGLLALASPAQADPDREAQFDCGVRARPADPGQPVFTRSAIPAVPLLFVNAERTFWEVALLYWQYDNLDERSRFRLLAPLLLDDCTPSSRTTLTPLAGWKRDRDGTAGYILSYYFRRDAHREADVLFPLYWHIRTWRADGSTVSSSMGIPPLVFRFESPGAVTWVAPLFYLRARPAGWDGALIPLYFGGQSAERRYALVPPLLTLYWQSAQARTLIVGPLYDRQSADGRHASALLPLWVYARGQHERLLLVPPLLTLLSETPDGATTVIGPYYDVRTAAGRWQGLLPFWLQARAPDGSHHLLSPPLLLLHMGDPTFEATVVGPFYAYHGAASEHAGLLPVFFRGRWRDGDHYTLVPPLLALHVGSATSETTVFGPIYDHETPTGYARGLVPLAMWSRAQGGRHYTLAPPLLLADFGDASSRATVVGPLYRYRGPESTHLGALPLVLAGRYTSGDHYLVLPPLLAVHAGGGGTETTLVGPFYDRQTPDGHANGLPPLWLWARERDQSHYLLVPPALLAHFGDATHEATVVGPVYDYQGPDSHHFGAVPIFFRGSWSNRDHYTLAPPLLLAHLGSATTETTIAGPFYDRLTPDGRASGLAPLFFRGARRDGSHYLLVPPALIAHFGDHDHEQTFVGPVYDYHDATSSHFGLVPVFFCGRYADGDHYTVVPPLAFVHAGGSESETTVLGPLYRHTHADGWDGGILPLAFLGRHKQSSYTLIAPPLVLTDVHHADGSHYTLIPPLLLAHLGDPSYEATVVGPLYGYRGRAGTHYGALPLALHGRFPDGDHYTLVPPLLALHAGGAESETTVVGPFYDRQTADAHDWGIALIAMSARYRDDSHYTVVPPLLLVHTGDPTYEQTILGPVYSYRGTSSAHDGVIPIWFQGRFRDGDHYLALPPLLTLHAGGAASETTVVGPFYTHSSADGTWTGVAPLVMTGQRADGAHYTLVPPALFLHRGDPSFEQTVLGPAYSYATSEQSHYGLFGLFSHGRSRNGDHYTLVPPALLWHWGSADSETTIVGPLFHHHSPDGTWTALPPLLFLADQTDGKHLTVAGNFYSYRDPVSAHDAILPIWLHGRWADGDHYTLIPPLLALHAGGAASETTVLGPSYYHSSSDGWDFGLVPGAFLGRHGSSSYALLAPPLFMNWAGQGESTTIAGPVYVHETPSATSVAVAPLAYYKSTEQSTRLTVFPLLHYSRTDDSETVLAPLYYHDRDPTSSHTMVFPFYWSAENVEGSSRVAFPVYWDFANAAGDSRLTLALPLYARYAKGSDTTNVLGNIVWTHGRSARGRSWSFHFFPAFSMESAYPEHLKWRVLMGMLGHERGYSPSAGTLTRWQVFYFWTDPST